MTSQTNINKIKQSLGIFLYTHFWLFGVLFALRASKKFCSPLLYIDSDLFIYTKLKHFTDKYKKLGDNKKTVRLPGSAVILIMVNENTSIAN